MIEPEYLPNDQRKHLGEPPWKAGPELDAWESAHNHDPRVKCYPEYGCTAVGAERDWLHSVLWHMVDAPRQYVGNEEHHRLMLIVTPELWDEAAKAVGYDEMGG